MLQGEEVADVVTQSDGEEIYPKVYKNARKEGVLFPNPTLEHECSHDKKMSYFVLFGYSLQSHVAPSAVIRNVDQFTCFGFCSRNQNTARTPSPCVSSNYDQSTKTCSLFGKRAKDEQMMAVINDNEDTIFADKFCLKAARSCSSDTPFVVYPFKQIHKRIIDWFGQIFTPVNCIAKCVDNVECKSVSYKPGMCILHGESPISDPSILIEGSMDTLVVENGCQLSAVNVPSLLSLEGALNGGEDGGPPVGEWEDWSGCVFGGSKYAPKGKGGKVRVRHRECPEGVKCEDLQVEAC